MLAVRLAGEQIKLAEKCVAGCALLKRKGNKNGEDNMPTNHRILTVFGICIQITRNKSEFPKMQHLENMAFLC